MDYIDRIFIPSKRSFFLFGPRGTGKSMWIKKNYPDSLYIDFLRSDYYRLYSSNPEYLIKLVNANPDKKVVVLDEIQKVPEVLSVVHSLIEERKDLQFILTGSSARKLKRSGVDLLAGRAINKSMYPFMASELGDLFKIQEALEYGMLPLVWNTDERENVLRSYVDLYVKEEVQYEGLVRKIGDFARFVLTMAFSHAEVINFSNIARECEVKRSTIENYFDILQNLLLGDCIYPFMKRSKRVLTKHPKFYFFDSGVYKSLRQAGPMDVVSEIQGNALEGLVAQHLRAWCSYTDGENNLFYWRTKSGVEVDFIVYGVSGFWAIEVKNNTKVFPKDVRGLISFKEDYPESHPILLYRGKDRIMERGVLCLPCEEFLKQLKPNYPITGVSH